MECIWVLTKKYPDKHIAQRNFDLVKKMFPNLAIELNSDIIKSTDYLGLIEALNKIGNNSENYPPIKYIGRH